MERQKQDRQQGARRLRGLLSAVLRAGLPLGLLAFLNVTRVQWNLPVDGPSIPHFGFPWRACAPGIASSLTLEVNPLALLGNLGVYLAVALALTALPAVRHRLASLPLALVLLLWLGVVASGGYRSLEFLVNDLFVADEIGFVGQVGLRDQAPAFAFCSGSRTGP